MTPQITEIIGTIGNILLVIAYVPQIVKILRTKKAEDISIWMWVNYFLGDILLLIYAINSGDTIFTMLFSFFTVGNFALLALTYKYGKLNKKIAMAKSAESAKPAEEPKPTEKPQHHHHNP